MKTPINTGLSITANVDTPIDVVTERETDGTLRVRLSPREKILEDTLEIDKTHGIRQLTVYANFNSAVSMSDSIMALMLLKDALDREYLNIDCNSVRSNGCSVSPVERNIPCRLVMPYFPYARDDRVMEPGAPFGAAVMAGIINGLGFTSVAIQDAHSDVTPALLGKTCKNNHVKDLAGEIYFKSERGIFPQSDKESTWSFTDTGVLVAPDAGATKKVKALGEKYDMSVVTAMKTRNVITKELSDTYIDVSEFDNTQGYLIVDDICDGGRTFVALAKELRKHTSGPIYLYVTHGIFSYGIKQVTDNFTHVFVENLWAPHREEDDDKLTVIGEER